MKTALGAALAAIEHSLGKAAVLGPVEARDLGG